MRTRRHRFVALLVSSVLLAAACGGGDDDEPDGSGGATGDDTAEVADDGDADTDADQATASDEPLVVGVPEDLDSTDPHAAVGETASVWLNLVYESLVALDRDARPVPGLATSWSYNDAGDVVTFELRDDVVFHDGTPFTSEAVRFSYERLQDPTVGGTSQAAAVVASIETPDDTTVVFNLTEPSGSFVADAAQPGKSAIISPNAVGDDGTIDEPIGTGPFTFEDYTVNDRLELAGFADHWAGAPNLAGITVRIIPDGSARVTALAGDEIQMGWNLPYEQAAPQAESGAFELVQLPQNRGNWIALNSQREPFDDVRVREALFLAISRQDIVDAAWDGQAVATVQPFTEDSPWYVDVDVRTEADVERAESLLADAGVAGGEIVITQWEALGSDLETQVIASAWEDLGFDVSIEKVDIATLTTQAYAEDSTVDAVSLWIGLNLDPNRPYSFFDSEGGRNGIVGNYAEQELDNLVREARAETDEATRLDLYGEVIEDWMLAESLQFYTVRPFQFVGISDRLEGYVQGTSYVLHDGGGMLTATLNEG